MDPGNQLLVILVMLLATIWLVLKVEGNNDFEPQSYDCINNPDLITHCCTCSGSNNNNNSLATTKTPRYNVTPKDYPYSPVAQIGCFGSSMKMFGTTIVVDNHPDFWPDQIVNVDTNTLVIEYSPSEGNWNYFLLTDDILGNGVGHTLALSENFILVGNPSDNPANVGIFVRTSLIPPWTITVILEEPSPLSEFGYSLAIDESTQQILVSDPSYRNDLGRVYSYYTYSDIIIDTLNHPYAATSQGSRFGHCIAMSETLAIISSPGDNVNGNNDVGSVHLFSKLQGSGDKWTYMKTFQPPRKSDSSGYLEGQQFGWSISLDGDFFVVGSHKSDQVEIYKTITPGDISSFHHFQTLSAPYVTTFISRFGYTVDLLGSRIVVGDPNYIVSPSAWGKVFTYEYSSIQNLWLPCQTFVDDVQSFRTHFGQEVSIGNSRFVAVSAPGVSSTLGQQSQNHIVGNIWVFDMNRLTQCAGCDGIVNSFKTIDACKICGGSNTTCMGCDHVPNSGKMFDYCGVCGGDNTTCLFVNPLLELENECVSSINPRSPSASSDGTQFFKIDHFPENNRIIWNIISPPSLGTLRIFNSIQGSFGYIPSSGIPRPSRDSIELTITDSFGHSVAILVKINLNPCTGCDGIIGSAVVYDLCGVCGGDSSSCSDCSGVPYGNKSLDYCSTCTDSLNANKTCLKIILHLPQQLTTTTTKSQGGLSTVFLSQSNDLTYEIPCGGSFWYNSQTFEPQRTLGHVRWSLLNTPEMGKAHVSFNQGNITYTHDRENHLYDGTDMIAFKAIDGYGNIGISKLIVLVVGCTVVGCDGVLGSGKIVDECEVCGGTNNCVDCMGIPNGNAVLDICGICGGTGDTCVLQALYEANAVANTTIPLSVWICFASISVVGLGVIVLYFGYFTIRAWIIKHRRRNHSLKKIVHSSREL